MHDQMYSQVSCHAKNQVSGIKKCFIILRLELILSVVPYRRKNMVFMEKI